MLTARAVYCAQNKYSFISIYTFVKYAKEVSGYEAMHWFSLFHQKKCRPLWYGPPFYFEAINNILSDAESREEQNDASHFVIEATTAKLWPLV